MRVDDRFELVLREAEALRALDHDHRAARIGALRQLDPDLAIAVEQHLRDLDRVSNHDPTMVDELLTWVDVEDDGVAPPEQIGDYQILKTLGDGGFGRVYLARPRPGVVAPGLVAIKLLKPGLHTPEVLARFHREERILAQLADDRIARLVSGGVHDGLPYFVMEYVEGQPLIAHCDERRLTTRERLALFARICHAVQHAHEVGIVHCDLKPANIFVSAAGATKLLDFGIAKSIRPVPGETDDVTGWLGRPLTAPYASPEQISGEPITPRSEVYTLGVVLYELLTGRRPYEMPRGVSEERARKIILTTEPPQPSQVVGRVGDRDSDRLSEVREGTTARLRTRLRGEVDLIVMKALKKEAGRRYQSVRELADDITNYLSGRPVTAHPDSFAYRVRKTAAKPRVFIPAIALVSLAMLTGWALTQRAAALRARATTSAALVKASESLVAERAAKEDADANLALAKRAIEDFFTKVSEDTLLKRQDAVEVRDFRPLRKVLLGIAATYYQQLLARRASDPALRLEQADAFKRLARITEEIGSKEDALGALFRTIAEYESLAQSRAGDPSLIRDVASIRRVAGSLLDDLGRTDLAISQLERARAEFVQSAGSDSDPDVIDELARVDNAKAIALRKLGRTNLALVEFERSRAAFRGLVERGVNDHETLSSLATAEENTGMSLHELGRGDAAPAALGRGRDIVESFARAEPTVVQYQSDLVAFDNNLVLVLKTLGRADEAILVMKRARAMLERLVKEHPSVTSFRADLATNHNNAGDALAAANRAAEARVEFEQGRAILERLAAEHPTVMDFQSSLAINLYNLGDLQNAAGEFATALGSGEAACKILHSLPDRAALNDFVLALAHDLCAHILTRRPGTLSTADTIRRDAHVEEALKSIRRAVDAGYRAIDPSMFKSLPSVHEFSTIVMDLAMPSEPFAATK